MTYVISEPCVDIMDRACVEECPVDCIYEGARALYIHPDECIDCGACEPVCPVEAIYYEDDLTDAFAGYAGYAEDNARFFTDTLPGMDGPLGSPGGAATLGPVPADTPLVAALPTRPSGDHHQDEARRCASGKNSAHLPKWSSRAADWPW